MMTVKKSSRKYKKDSMNWTNSKTVPEKSDVRGGRKRHLPVKQNSGKRKKRNM